jgi:hypothetical protein
MINLRLSAMLLIIFSITLSARAATDQETINQARQAYYNLKTAGVIGFRCHIQPDWDSILTSAQDDETTQDEVLPIMKEMHFEVLVGPDGAPTVSRQFDVPPPNQDIAERAASIADGIEKIITDFYQVWSLFLVNSPFSDPGTEFKLKDSDGKYRLFYKKGPNDVSLSMSHDFTIEEMKVSSDQFDATTHPLFVRVGNGLVLKGYQTILNTLSGTAARTDVVIVNDVYEGVTLPHTTIVTVRTANSSIVTTLTFSNYQLQKR